MHGVRRLASWSLLLATLGHPTASALAMDPWTYAAGHYTLELDGAAAGALRSAEGGDARADVMSRGTGGPYANKRLTQVRYSELRIEAGAGMEPAFYDWIAATWDAKISPKSGAVLMLDSNNQVVERREFFNALLTEMTLPAFDVASKDAAYLTVRIAPERVQLSKGSGSAPPATAKTQRSWSVSNFRLEIAGLDCSRVRKIESFTVKQAVADDAVGDARQADKVAGRLTFSDLAVTLPKADADTWEAWAKTFLYDGKNDDSQEKKGDLVLLGSDGKSEIARVHLLGLGLKSLVRQTGASANSTGSMVAAMYCERAAFEWKGGTGAVVNAR